jgi:hypothetical protein
MSILGEYVQRRDASNALAARRPCGLDRPGGLWLRFFSDQFRFFTAVLAFKSAHLSH